MHIRPSQDPQGRNPVKIVVGSNNSFPYNISKYLTTILSPLVGKIPHHIQNSNDFTSKVWDLRVDPEETMVSYDVTSLLTYTPTSEAMETVR